MAKKATKLSTPRGAAAKARARSKRRKKPAATQSTALVVANPPIREVAEFAIPGFAGYGATRLVQRITYVQLSKRFPRAAKHLSVGSGLVTFLAAWYLLDRVKRLEKHHVPAAVGSLIAVLQSIIQAYLPKFGWIVSDYYDAVPKRVAAKPAAELEESASEPDDYDTGDFGSLTGSTIGAPVDDLDDDLAGDDLDDDF